jgi:hypothetical protein
VATNRGLYDCISYRLTDEQNFARYKRPSDICRTSDGPRTTYFTNGHADAHERGTSIDPVQRASPNYRMPQITNASRLGKHVGSGLLRVNPAWKIASFSEMFLQGTIS